MLMINIAQLIAVVASLRTRGWHSVPTLLKYPAYAPAVFLVTVFILSVFSSSLYDSKRAIQVLFIIITSLYLLFSTTNLSINYSPFSVLLLSTCILSIDRLNPESLLYLLHFIFIFSFIKLGEGISKHLSFTFLGIFFFNLIIIFCSILNLSISLSLGFNTSADDIVYGFNNIRFFNQVQALSIPIIIYYLNDKKISNIAFFTLALNISLLLITGARGAILATITVFFLSIFLKAVTPGKIKTILASVLVGVILYGLYIHFLGSSQVLDYAFRTSSSNRIEIWYELIHNLSIKEVFLGNGLGSYVNYDFGVRHPHNSLLQLTYEIGAISTITIVIFIFRVIKKNVIRSRDAIILIEHQVCLLSFLSMLILSLFSGVIVMPIPQTFMLIFLGVLLTNIEKKGVTINSLCFKIICLPLLLAYLMSIFVTYNCKDNNYLGPNFWADGQFSLEYCKFSLKDF